MKVVLQIFFVVYSLHLIDCKSTYVLDENWICNVKKDCVDCLKLPHCTWCGESQKCFSKELPEFQDFCKDNATEHVDYGFSLEDNAACGCLGDALENRCRPPFETEGPECSGRGVCLCGRCVCDSTPDPELPTKMVVGEFCELDNFSCYKPKCNHEGPYHYKDDVDDA